ncbi:DoxX family protein [Nocardioides montaniterrae]
MNIALWIIAGLLAAAFLMAGSIKLTRPKDKLAGNMPWVEDYSPGQVKAIGAIEVLGALGLILPAALDIAPILTPIAATGLALTMAGAVVVHIRHGETPMAAPSVVLLALAAFVAIMRFGPNAF